jgi:hypothetical protein
VDAKDGGDTFGQSLLDRIAVFLSLIAAEGSVGGASTVVADIEQ